MKNGSSITAGSKTADSHLLKQQNVADATLQQEPPNDKDDSDLKKRRRRSSLLRRSLSSNSLMKSSQAVLSSYSGGGGPGGGAGGVGTRGAPARNIRSNLGSMIANAVLSDKKKKNRMGSIRKNSISNHHIQKEFHSLLNEDDSDEFAKVQEVSQEFSQEFSNAFTVNRNEIPTINPISINSDELYNNNHEANRKIISGLQSGRSLEHDSSSSSTYSNRQLGQEYDSAMKHLHVKVRDELPNSNDRLNNRTTNSETVNAATFSTTASGDDSSDATENFSSKSNRRQPLNRSGSFTSMPSATIHTVANPLDVTLQLKQHPIDGQFRYELCPHHTGNNRVGVMVDLQLDLFAKLQQEQHQRAQEVMTTQNTQKKILNSNQICVGIVNTVEQHWDGRFLLQVIQNEVTGYTVLPKRDAVQAVHDIFLQTLQTINTGSSNDDKEQIQSAQSLVSNNANTASSLNSSSLNSSATSTSPPEQSLSTLEESPTTTENVQPIDDGLSSRQATLLSTSVEGADDVTLSEDHNITLMTSGKSSVSPSSTLVHHHASECKVKEPQSQSSSVASRATTHSEGALPIGETALPTANTSAAVFPMYANQQDVHKSALESLMRRKKRQYATNKISSLVTGRSLLSSSASSTGSPSPVDSDNMSIASSGQSIASPHVTSQNRDEKAVELTLHATSNSRASSSLPPIRKNESLLPSYTTANLGGPIMPGHLGGVEGRSLSVSDIRTTNGTASSTMLMGSSDRPITGMEGSLSSNLRTLPLGRRTAHQETFQRSSCRNYQVDELSAVFEEVNEQVLDADVETDLLHNFDDEAIRSRCLRPLKSCGGRSLSESVIQSGRNSFNSMINNNNFNNNSIIINDNSNYDAVADDNPFYELLQQHQQQLLQNQGHIGTNNDENSGTSSTDWRFSINSVGSGLYPILDDSYRDLEPYQMEVDAATPSNDLSNGLQEFQALFSSTDNTAVTTNTNASSSSSEMPSLFPQTYGTESYLVQSHHQKPMYEPSSNMISNLAPIDDRNAVGCFQNSMQPIPYRGTAAPSSFPNKQLYLQQLLQQHSLRSSGPQQQRQQPQNFSRHFNNSSSNQNYGMYQHAQFASTTIANDNLNDDENNNHNNHNTLGSYSEEHGTHRRLRGSNTGSNNVVGSANEDTYSTSSYGRRRSSCVAPTTTSTISRQSTRLSEFSQSMIQDLLFQLGDDSLLGNDDDSCDGGR